MFDLSHYSTDLQFEAASGLTNTASGSYDQTVTVARADDIPKLANLLRSKSTDVAQRSVWQLCKIASVGPVKRDEVLNCTADILEIANNCIESQPVCNIIPVFRLFVLFFKFWINFPMMMLIVVRFSAFIFAQNHFIIINSMPQQKSDTTSR